MNIIGKTVKHKDGAVGRVTDESDSVPNGYYVVWEDDMVSCEVIPSKNGQITILDEPGEQTLADYIASINRKYEDEDAPKEKLKHSHYYKDVSNLNLIDVYRVLDLFEVTDPCLQIIRYVFR